MLLVSKMQGLKTIELCLTAAETSY